MVSAGSDRDFLQPTLLPTNVTAESSSQLFMQSGSFFCTLGAPSHILISSAKIPILANSLRLVCTELVCTDAVKLCYHLHKSSYTLMAQ
jgi:hypothetical protein